MIFSDRAQAGRQLIPKLSYLKNQKNLVVLAIPKGGILVGKPIALALNTPLEVIISKKISAPLAPELAIGAVASTGEPVINEELAQRVGANDYYLKQQTEITKQEVVRREKEFRADQPPLNLKGKTVVLVDDGVATGSTVLLAIELVRQQEPQKIIVAIPVIAQESLDKIQQLADEVIYLEAPKLFFAVSQFYRDFSVLTDDQVKQILYNKQ